MKARFYFFAMGVLFAFSIRAITDVAMSDSVSMGEIAIFGASFVGLVISLHELFEAKTK